MSSKHSQCAVLLRLCPSILSKPSVIYRTWENFGGGKFWRINGSKVFGEENFGESVSSLLKILAFINIGEEKFGKSVGSVLKILVFINIGGENFGELPTIRQIRQKFPPSNFPTYGNKSN